MSNIRNEAAKSPTLDAWWEQNNRLRKAYLTEARKADAALEARNDQVRKGNPRSIQRADSALNKANAAAAKALKTFTDHGKTYEAAMQKAIKKIIKERG